MLSNFIEGVFEVIVAFMPVWIIAAVIATLVLVNDGNPATTPEKENAIPARMTIEKVEFEGRTYIIFRSFYGNSDMHVIAQP